MYRSHSKDISYMYAYIQSKYSLYINIVAVRRWDFCSIWLWDFFSIILWNMFIVFFCLSAQLCRAARGALGRGDHKWVWCAPRWSLVTPRDSSQSGAWQQWRGEVRYQPMRLFYPPEFLPVLERNLCWDANNGSRICYRRARNNSLALLRCWRSPYRPWWTVDTWPRWHPTHTTLEVCVCWRQHCCMNPGWWCVCCQPIKKQQENDISNDICPRCSSSD